MVLIPT